MALREYIVQRPARVFEDRRDAGRLSEKCSSNTGDAGAIVLALPSGGVPVG
jgi:predicted phosphoribosyltransferase